MSNALLDPPADSRGASDRTTLATSLAGLALVAAATSWPLLMMGLAAASVGDLFGGAAARVRPAIRLRALTAITVLAVGLAIHGRSPAPGMILVVAGLGGLAGWLPFAWRTSDEASELLNADRMPGTVGLIRQLTVTTAALVVAWKLTPTVFQPLADRSLPVLYFAAVLSLFVGSARLWSTRRFGEILPLFSAMALSGIAADVALSREEGRLPIRVPSGGGLGLAVWLHAAVECLLLNVARRRSLSGDDPSAANSAWRRWLRMAAQLDLAGVPPLPGFWLRGGLLLALVSRQSTSNITGEFEPQSGMLALAIAVALTWGIIMATALARALSLDDDSAIT